MEELKKKKAGKEKGRKYKGFMSHVRVCTS